MTYHKMSSLADGNGVPSYLINSVREFRAELPDTLVTRLIELGFQSNPVELYRVVEKSKNSKALPGGVVTYCGEKRCAPVENREYANYHLEQKEAFNYHLNVAKRVESVIDEKITECVNRHTRELRELLERMAAQSKATEPQATEPQATEPKATEPQVTEPQATEPQATEPQANTLDSSEAITGIVAISTFLVIILGFILGSVMSVMGKDIVLSSMDIVD